ncbi:mediator of RNA polymerase II transcription subunit 13 isoform X2 [Chrysoperla carnea]|uniref:mediator of RNA polymerase II transcription subunit 13 isoform X2 n=1 Tax=Chrysoperla carnea TaxID=189513 RepID=UPI001D08FE8F|nr:mediator of RNA polymerase II transcription subunit 13 isoform X2 [Chrysoperla carnea]
MTHPNHLTNGASLEDCHTNFFALTDLCGIKWRKLVWGESTATEPLEDPVLRSYSRCLASDILCVWRRVATPPPPPPPSANNGAGGGLFDSLTSLQPTVTSASHNVQQPPLSLAAAKELWIFWYGEEPDLSELVSPELLSSEGEQGSWESGLSYECRSLLFKALHNLIERCLLSRDFIKLGKWFVQPYSADNKTTGASSTHFSFSFAFFVHGESTVCASVDVRRHPAVRRLGRKHLLQAQTVPTALPVILAPFGLAGVLTGQAYRAADWTTRLLEDWKRFFPLDYRSPIRGDPDAPPPIVEVLVGGMKMRYPSCYVLVTDMDEDPTTSPVTTPSTTPTPFSTSQSSVTTTKSTAIIDEYASELPESVWQECIHGIPQAATLPLDEMNDGHWDFTEPTNRVNCTCAKQQQPESSTTPQGGPPSYSRNQTDSLPPMPSVGSPPSAAPSPLPNPNSQQPTSVGGCGGEHTMPTLSPQHISGAPASAGPPTQVHTPTPPASIEPRPSVSSVAATSNTSTPVNSLSTCNNNPNNNNSNTNTNNNNVTVVPSFKRPVLSSRDYETAILEDEQPLDLLYDYTTLEAWLHHPVKRFKGDTSISWKSKNGDLYANQTHSNGPTTFSETNNDVNGCGNIFIKTEIKKEPIDCMVDSNQPLTTGQKRPGDPYDFDDHENVTGASHIDGFKRGPLAVVKEENKDGKPNVDLFTAEGLQPSYKDLEQIFDNSDDTSSDDALQVHTPPGSNKSIGALEDTKRILNSHTSSSGILRQEELSKMFPTPPSLEHNPVASPCGQLDFGTNNLESIEIKQEIYPLMGSPREEAIDDWSYVFKPPVICKMVGSSKYAPLTNLPSQNLPPVVFPPHCVYKPSWRKAAQQPVVNNVNNTPSTTHPPTTSLPRRTPCPPLPPPPPYELPSPATSTASSYLNKTLNSVEPATPSLQRQPEADSLIVNILLADTALNIFRDHNFDSCTLCVCNAGPKVVGNIRGADAGMYLVPALPPGSPMGGGGGGMGGQYSSGMSPPQHHNSGGYMSTDDDLIRCSCGFSAIVNRKLSHRSGLFYEDELEITGIAEDPAERKKPSLLTSLLTSVNPENKEQIDTVPQNIIEMIREQCVIVQSSSNSLFRASKMFKGKSSPHFTSTVNVLELNDGNEITALALDGKSTSGSMYVHRWPFLRAAGPHCNQDIVRVMRTLQPLLQEAIQKKCTTRLWEAPYTVKGPLTWRQFHRLAGRGTDDRCEPQPIPSLIVGHDKDWLSLSPFALQHWDKFLLEPYSYSRDIAYIVVTPDNDAIITKVKKFFKELSTAYEDCKLGKHSPITKVLRDGILRVGKSAKTKLAGEPIDEWFNALGDNKTSDMIKLYAQVCRHHLAPHLCQVPMDRTLLESPEGPSTNNSVTIVPSSTTSNDSTTPATPKSESGSSEIDSFNTSTTPASLGDMAHDEDEGQPPSIVIYLVEPFTTGTDRPELQRLACLSLLRCFQSVLNAVPEHVRSNVSVQIISQESIIDMGKNRSRAKQSDHMKALALNVFSQCRRLLVHTSNIKSLTGFGTAAMADLFLKNKDDKNRAPYKLYTPPYILAPLKERTESAESFGQISSEECSVLYLSYCLSEDQSWLLAVATDERGEILETCVINIDVPNRSRRKKASARRMGLQRLMDFTLGVMSQSVRPWRLVVGRIGRIGHGELKGWSWLLSRKALIKASKHLKEICDQCSLMYPSGVPCILSACLVSIEPDSALRLMPDQFTPDERFSQASVNCQLSTPHDVSCTHILVFPTSATTQSSQTAFHEQHINGPELGDDELFSALNDDDMPEGIDGMNDFNEIFNGWPETGPGGGLSPNGSPRRESGSPSPGSPSMGGTGRSPFPCGDNRGSGEQQEEVGTLLQQPLALGYLVSTAPTGRMPTWFWASCPHLESVCPTFLKNALHLHSPSIQQNSDDLLQQQSSVTVHPLDSQFTTDVLRYVLEGYNALSWLALDSNTHDRLSCLPVHIQVLMQLYHMTASLL